MATWSDDGLLARQFDAVALLPFYTESCVLREKVRLIRLVSIMSLADLKRLYPHLSQEKLEEAEENIKQYLLLAWDIWEAREKRRAGAVPQSFDVPNEPPYDQGKVDSLPGNTNNNSTNL
jgi:hypothetical protein